MVNAITINIIIRSIVVRHSFLGSSHGRWSIAASGLRQRERHLEDSYTRGTFPIDKCGNAEQQLYLIELVKQFTDDWEGQIPKPPKASPVLLAVVWCRHAEGNA